MRRLISKGSMVYWWTAANCHSHQCSEFLYHWPYYQVMQRTNQEIPGELRDMVAWHCFLLGCHQVLAHCCYHYYQCQCSYYCYTIVTIALVYSCNVVEYGWVWLLIAESGRVWLRMAEYGTVDSAWFNVWLTMIWLNIWLCIALLAVVLAGTTYGQNGMLAFTPPFSGIIYRNH